MALNSALFLGQVLRGKIIGKPPCFESFYENLQIRNLTQMENADVAIKMLPKYADEAAKVCLKYRNQNNKSCFCRKNL